MDQVKIYLAILKKHHFWLVSALAALVGVICWWMGSSSLATQYTANKSTVDGKFKSIAGLNGDLANGSFAGVVDTLHTDAKAKVFEEWKKQYERQQKLFVWPDVTLVKDIPTLQQGDKPLGSDVRQMYKQLVFPNELERVFTIANIRRREMRTVDSMAPNRPITAVGQQPGQQPVVTPQEQDAAEESQEEDGLVVWDAGHRAQLLARYDFVHKPGLEISEVNLRTAQEDMWILEQLAKIIAKTNEGATDEAALAVKRINAMDVAQWAVEESQRFAPTLRLPKPTAAAPAAAAAASAPTGEEGAPAAASPDAQAKEDTELLDGRYLTDANQPATADDTSFSEFKRIFVRMKLDVDQRKLNELLVNCANSELPLDVIRVQVDLPLMSKEKSTSTTQSQTSGSNSDIVPGPYDVPVEICGVMQIYNPPDPEKLAQGSGDPTKRSLDMPTGKVKNPRPIARSAGPGMNR